MEEYGTSNARAIPILPEEARGWWRLYPVWGVDERGVCMCGKGERCDDPGKHPVRNGGAQGLQLRQLEPQETERMFAAAPRGSNVGLATGKASGVVILDEDTFGGASSLTGT